MPEETTDLGPSVKRLTVREFRELGYLQELNRLFLHPLGLSLHVGWIGEATRMHAEVLDGRDSPEGVVFPEGELSKPEAWEKVVKVRREMEQRRAARERLLGGSIIQQVPPGEG